MQHQSLWRGRSSSKRLYKWENKTSNVNDNIQRNTDISMEKNRNKIIWSFTNLFLLLLLSSLPIILNNLIIWTPFFYTFWSLLHWMTHPPSNGPATWHTENAGFCVTLFSLPDPPLSFCQSQQKRSVPTVPRVCSFQRNNEIPLFQWTELAALGAMWKWRFKGPLPFFRRRTLIGYALIFTDFFDQSE